MSYHSEITELIEKYTRESAYQELHWEGSMAEYLQILGESPAILRNAFQRIYDMIVSYGVEEYTENKEKLVRYKFFSDPDNDGEDRPRAPSFDCSRKDLRPIPGPVKGPYTPFPGV
jgi:hypothetical protein